MSSIRRTGARLVALMSIGVVVVGMLATEARSDGYCDCPRLFFRLEGTFRLDGDHWVPDAGPADGLFCEREHSAEAICSGFDPRCDQDGSFFSCPEGRGIECTNL